MFTEIKAELKIVAKELKTMNIDISNFQKDANRNSRIANYNN